MARNYSLPLLALFACSLILFSGTSIAQDKSAVKKSQIWYGEMDAGPRVFRFVITTSLDDSGKISGQLKSLDEGGAQFELNDVVLDKDKFSFALKRTAATYDAKLSEDGAKATGKWSQSAANFDLVLDKRDAIPVDEPSEIWLGTMTAVFQKLDIQVRIYVDKNGKQNAFVDSVSQNLGGFKAKITSEGKKINFDVPSLKAKYSGVKNEDGSEIVGKWSQGVPLALTLARKDKVAEYARAIPKRTQTPKAPFPYQIEEVSFKNAKDGTVLAGTLTRPKSSGPFPIAILISGSGPQDRDESLLDHKPFWILADYLSRNGVAVLRFDDRGIGKSTGKFEKATTLDFAGDVNSAIAFAKTLDAVNSQQIGLIGHSEGGLVATIVAAENKDVAWVVLMASPGVNGEQIMLSQGQLIIAAEGGSEEAKKRQRILQEHAFAKAKEIEASAEVDPHVDGIVDEIVDEILASAKLDSAEPEPVKAASEEEALANRKVLTELVRANLKAMNDPWFRFFATYEPAPDLQKIHCPVLALNGEKDVQVDPKLNLPKIEAALKAGGNKDFAVVELPSLNHLFQTCKTGGLSEYQSIEETLAPIALETISKWIASHTQSK